MEEVSISITIPEVAQCKCETVAKSQREDEKNRKVFQTGI